MVKIISNLKISYLQITETFVVPPIVTLFAKSALVDKYHLNLTELGCGAGMLSQEVEQLLYQKFPGIKMRQCQETNSANINIEMFSWKLSLTIRY